MVAQARQIKQDEKKKLKELHWMRRPKCGMELVEIDFDGIKVEKCSAPYQGALMLATGPVWLYVVYKVGYEYLNAFRLKNGEPALPAIEAVGLKSTSIIHEYVRVLNDLSFVYGVGVFLFLGTSVVLKV